MHVVCMLYACCMHVVCMLYACCMHVVCMFNSNLYSTVNSWCAFREDTAQHSWPELATSEVACVTHGKDCGDRSLETTANVASNELLTFYERLSVTCVGR